jgi:uncharacterized damage-inducible protein DinB
MRIADLLLSELEHEARLTRRALERVRPDLADWKPHPRSMSLSQLASHVVELPLWVVSTLDRDELDIGTPAGAGGDAPHLTTAETLIETFTTNVEKASSALATASDEDLLKPWALLSNGTLLMREPRFRVVANDVLNHLVHHRAQLTLYLRLNEIPVPGLYGPSADESKDS